MSDSTWYPRDSEAASLAAQFRSQRLTLLFGESGSGKTTLLTAGVLPLLHRRATDSLDVMDVAASAAAVAAAAGGVVLPFPERRSPEEPTLVDSRDAVDSGPGALDTATGGLDKNVASDGEVSVFFDTWDQSPLEGLLARLREALDFPNFEGTRKRRSLASTLGAYHRQRGGKSLIVLDRFEEFLVQPEYAPGARQFGDALVDAMNRPGLPVHFLISLNEEAAPLLERFRGRIAGLDDHCMRLPPLRKPIDGPPAIPVLRQVPDGYKPPIDLELPYGSAPPSVPPNRPDSVGTMRVGGRSQGTSEPPPPEFATSRQPEWLESAFSSSSSNMKTQDVYASMESLLGKIVDGTKEAEQRMPSIRAAAQEAFDDSAATEAIPSASVATPEPASAAVADPATEASAATVPTAAVPESTATQSAPTQVWPPSTLAAQQVAAPEFDPIVHFQNFQTGDSRRPARVTSERPIRGEPETAVPNADWLSEVHASLTKLSTPQSEPEGEQIRTFDINEFVAEPVQVDRRPEGRKTLVVVLVLLLLLVLAAASTFLPAPYRPFEMPAEITNLINSNTPAPGSNSLEGVNPK